MQEQMQAFPARKKGMKLQIKRCAPVKCQKEIGYMVYNQPEETLTG